MEVGVNLGRDLGFGACGILDFSQELSRVKGMGLFDGLVWSKEGLSFMLLDESTSTCICQNGCEFRVRLVSLHVKNPELKFGNPEPTQVKQCQESEWV